jgi:hypothetical protein
MYPYYFLAFCTVFWLVNGCEKYRKFRQLNRLVATKYNTVGSILLVSLNMVCKMYWLQFLQWLNSNIKHIDRKTIEITYTINGKVHALLVNVHRGPPKVIMVCDEDDEDVTDEIVKYMGPNEDWHNRKYSPDFWNKNSLTFELMNGETVTFQRNDPITL